MQFRALLDQLIWRDCLPRHGREIDAETMRANETREREGKGKIH